MGYIKEPEGVDFVVDPTPLTNDDRIKISKLIAYYKATGRKMAFPKSKKQLPIKMSTKGKAMT